MSNKKEDDKGENRGNHRLIKSPKKELKDSNRQETLSMKRKTINKLSPFQGLTPNEEKRLTRRLTSILITLTVGILITLYIISPLSKLQNIEVTGIDKADSQTIIKSSHLKLGEGLWPQYFNKSNDMKRVIKENPRINTATLRIKQFNHFDINVTEYEVLAVLLKNDKMYPVLSNGKILSETAKESEKKLPQLIDFKEGEGLKSFLTSYEKFSPKMKSEIISIESQATQKNPFRIKLNMKDGNQVIGLSTTIADKLVFYDKIAAEMKSKGVIDMEAGKTGVFSYPLETQNSDSSEGLSDENSSESINNGF